MAGIYLSYPFCAQKCTFCNFASGVHGREVEARYVERMLREIRETELPFIPDTLYIGGGTPSSMAEGDMDSLLAGLPFPFREATLEAAPGTLNAAVVPNFNRVSLGVQSFVEAELRRTGRTHSSETVERDVALLRRLGISNFNIDLIAGLPGQTAESWEQSLQWVKRLEAPHVSIYMFEIDEDSRLGAEVLLNGKRYGARDLPDEDLTAALYETAVARLAQWGIARYEISNFARPGFESIHNLKYWRLAPYIGFGADAHSFHGARRWQNPESIEEYLAPPTHREMQMADSSERFWVGLRLSRGVEPSIEEWRTYQEPIERLMEHGLLQRSGPALRLTDRGVMISNEVFKEFLPA